MHADDSPPASGDPCAADERAAQGTVSAERAGAAGTAEPVEVGGPRSDSRGDGTGRGREALALGVVLAGYAALAWRQRFVTDDAYISFRYMRNWAEGAGLVYNADGSAPVEGYSNFLLVAVGALMHRAGLALEVAIPLLTAACGAGLVALLYALLRRRVGLSAGLAALATAAAAWSAPFVTWATGGLATMPFALLVLALFERLVLRPAGPDARIGAPLAAALALVRVEGFAWCLAILALAALVHASRSRAARASETAGGAGGSSSVRAPLAGERASERGARWGRSLLVVLAALVSVQGAFLAWRFATYGALVSNTVSAKVAPGLATFARGLDYVLVQVLTTPTFALALLAPLIALRRGRREMEGQRAAGSWRAAGPVHGPGSRRAAALVVGAMALGFPAFAVLVGGDFMAFGRFLVPALAFDALLLGWLLADVAGRRSSAEGSVAAAQERPSSVRLGVAGALGLGVVAVGVAPAFDVHVVPRAVRERFHFRWNKEAFASEHARWREQRWRARHWAVLGDALRAVSRPGDAVVLGAMGAVGYRSGLTVIDCYGLVTPEVRALARDDAERELRSPGHDDPVEPFFFVERGATPTFLGAWLVPDRAKGRVEKLRRELRANAEASAGWVSDVRRVPTDGAPLWLVLWRRLEPGEDLESARRTAAARALAVAQGRGGSVPLVDMPLVVGLADEP